jgi:uncharacterized membrane protein
MSNLDSGHRPFPAGRLEAFSDGVFAIAITLLVLDIGVPAASGDDLLGAILDEWPSYLAYFVSFATVGALWLGHSVMTDALVGSDQLLMRYNLLTLMAVSLLPFPTRLLSEYLREEDAERVAVTVYGVVLLLAASMLSLTWRHALRSGLVRTDIEDRRLDELTRRLTPGVAGYASAIAVGLFLPMVAVSLYVLIAAFLILPRRRSPRTTG